MWPLGDHVVVNKATTIADRLAAARGCVAATGLEWPVYADTMDDAHVAHYLCHPERFFVLGGDGTLLLKGQPIEGGYNLTELERFLSEGGLFSP